MADPVYVLIVSTDHPDADLIAAEAARQVAEVLDQPDTRWSVEVLGDAGRSLAAWAGPMPESLAI